MFKRILIANRGEIARRIARTCQRLQIEFVAVYSSADLHAAHLAGAVRTVHIGPAAAASSYLNIDTIIGAAVDTGCDAIHPGYGFLSENADFAAAVENAGLVFIGPSAATIASMGNKAQAKQLMAAANVPTIPGSSESTESYGMIKEVCNEIGYPIILKPVAGGGGKGMQVVTDPADLKAALEAAIRIGKANFGDGRVIVERYIAQPRHLEVQIFGDRHGNVVHMFERECSLQRRHQKIIEEAPACNLPPDTRAELLAAAVRGAQALGYVNAGTFEFILAPGGQFYFLEVNTRLQVEHPVTEAITDLDLVEWQLRVAAGERLPRTQDAIQCQGHAIECRVYAEDPDLGFCPMPGDARMVQWPRDCRVDAAFDHHGSVPTFYDPMVAKLITHGKNRSESLQRMRDAIQQTTILGLTTNLGFAGRLLLDGRVQSGDVDTHLVDDFIRRVPHTSRAQMAAACACAIALADSAGSTTRSPWAGSIGPVDRLALDPAAPLGKMRYQHNTETLLATVLDNRSDIVKVQVGEHRFQLSAQRAGMLWKGDIGELSWSASVAPDHVDMMIGGTSIKLVTNPDLESESGAAQGGRVMTPMPGMVVALQVSVGDWVEQNAIIAVVEAMKMENRIHAPIAGTVTEINCQLSAVVSAGQTLAIIVPLEA